MKTIMVCKEQLSKKEQDVLQKHPKVKVVLTSCDGLDESQPVIYKLPEGVFYGNVMSNRLTDVIVGSADDLKIQTARLFDVSMGTYMSEPLNRKIVSELYQKLNELELFNADVVSRSIEEYAKRKNLSLNKVVFPMKIALIGTTKGPALSDLIVTFGWDETSSRIERFLSSYKYRY